MSYTSDYIEIDKDTIEPIIGMPCCGWASFQMPAFHGQLSYIDDAMTIILDNILSYLDHKPCVMDFDEEGSEFHVIIQPYNTFIIAERNKPELYAYEVDANILIQQIITDIEVNFEKWTMFDIIEIEDSDYKAAYEKNKKTYSEKLKRIKEKLKG